MKKIFLSLILLFSASRVYTMESSAAELTNMATAVPTVSINNAINRIAYALHIDPYSSRLGEITRRVRLCAADGIISETVINTIIRDFQNETQDIQDNDVRENIVTDTQKAYLTPETEEDRKEEYSEEYQDQDLLNAKLIHCIKNSHVNPDEKLAQAQTLLESKAEIDAIDWNGDSILNIACLKGYYPMVELLIHHQADVNYRGCDDRGTPLHCAAHFSIPNNAKEYTAIIKLLLKEKADPNIMDKHGEIALATAIATDAAEATKTLILETNVNPNKVIMSPTRFEKTPLQYTLDNEKHAATFILLASGTNSHIKDESLRNDHLPWTRRLLHRLFPPTIFDRLTTEQQAIADSAQKIQKRVQGSQDWVPKQQKPLPLLTQHLPDDLAKLVCDYCDVYTIDIQHPLVEQFEDILIERQIRENKTQQKLLKQQKERHDQFNQSRIYCGLDF